jgi:hypothetical protein
VRRFVLLVGLPAGSELATGFGWKQSSRASCRASARVLSFREAELLGERLCDLIASGDPPAIQTESLMDHSGDLVAA